MKIDLETQDFPQFRLSTNEDLILFLIRNELLSAKLINQLSIIGFDTSFFSFELGIAILSLMGFRDRTDTLWKWYHDMLDSYVLKINLDNHNAVKAIIFDFYVELRVKLYNEQKK
ncbi:hypothetical protein [Aquimarina longa]|uniref:hypothetical protein n=1 Tax=Aquimarina longa TaxID=1080221 RepID=UPI000781A3DE|nr:hypothetical protein [Aquimarina longa]